jgi:hypothetical protein
MFHVKEAFMKKSRIVSGIVIILLVATGLTVVVVNRASRQAQHQARQLGLSSQLNRVTFAPVSEVSFDAARDQSIHDWYLNAQGMIFAIFKDPTGEYLIRVSSPDGALASEFRCAGPIWEKPAHIQKIAADDSENIYVAVEWSWQRHGIVVVNSSGELVSKLALTDFLPMTLAVDRERRVWVAGWELTSDTPGEHPKEGPNAEQIRVYDQSLKLLDIPVRNLRRAGGVSSISAVDNEVMYYAMGTDELYIFRDGKLADQFLVGEVPRLELPLEAKGKDVEVLRGVLGTFKLDDLFVVVGFYSYKWKDQGFFQQAGKNFMTLINPKDMTISAELAAPRGGLTRSNLKGELIYLSGGRQEGAYRLTRTRLVF